MADDRPLGEQLRHVVDGAVATIELNRPESGNALTPAQRERIVALLDEDNANVAVRAVLLTATGDRAFCTGADLRVDRPDAHPVPTGAPARPVLSVDRTCLGAQRLIAALQDCDKPIVCAVNGTAAGIGAHLAFASDLVLAADHARFIEVFVRRGIVPDGGGAYLLTRLVGPQVAKELVFFGDDLSAGDAQRLGLVNRVVPADELDATVREWAERLAAGPTVALGLAKRLLNRSTESDRLTAFAEEAVGQELATSSMDAQEGVASFVERRPTHFRGW